MSQKINAKNLQYNLNLPPFLARLRGQGASGADSDGPDPILAARRRPVKPRSASADAEDAPLVVDEHGNSVEVTVGADGTVTEKEEPTPVGSEDKAQQDDAPADADAPASGEKVAGIGGQRKRKIGKVVGVGADEEDTEEKNNLDRTSRGKGKAKTGNTTAVQGIKEKDDSAAAAKSKTKKKAKKIKLSFGDDEG
jgi:hypothetical protein